LTRAHQLLLHVPLPQAPLLLLPLASKINALPGVSG
jgi:hypothetical protein